MQQSRRTIAIYKQDGTRHGDFGRSVPLGVMEQQLRDLGLEPMAPQYRVLPNQHVALAGLPTACCNVFELYEDEFLENADEIQNSGFRLWPEKDDPASRFYQAEDVDDWETDDTQPADRETSMSGNAVTCEADPLVEAFTSQSTSEDIGQWLDLLVGMRIRVYQRDIEAPGGKIDPERINLIVDPETRHICKIWLG